MNQVITKFDIVRFLGENGIYPNSFNEAHNLVAFFDSDNKGSLNISDFVQLFLPCEDRILREMVLARKQIHSSNFVQKLNPKLEEHITNIIM